MSLIQVGVKAELCSAVERCRRSLMAVHFDEVWDDNDCNQMCDMCRNKKGVLYSELFSI